MCLRCLVIDWYGLQYSTRMCEARYFDDDRVAKRENRDRLNINDMRICVCRQQTDIIQVLELETLWLFTMNGSICWSIATDFIYFFGCILRYVFITFDFVFHHHFVISLLMLLAHAFNQIFTFILQFNVLYILLYVWTSMGPPDPVDLLLICDYYWFFHIFFFVTRCLLFGIEIEMCAVNTCFIKIICIIFIYFLSNVDGVFCALIDSDLFCCCCFYLLKYVLCLHEKIGVLKRRKK